MTPNDKVRVLAYLDGRTKPATRGQIMSYATVLSSTANELGAYLDQLVGLGLVEVSQARVKYSRSVGLTDFYLATDKLRIQGPYARPMSGQRLVGLASHRNNR